MLALDAVVKAGWTSAVFARLCAVKMSPFLQKRTLSSNFILSIGLSGDLQSIMVGEKAMITKDDAMKNDNHHSGHEMTCRERLPGIVNLVKIMLVRGIGIEDVSAALITSVTKVLKHSNRLNIK
jgi:hypothetical protein